MRKMVLDGADQPAYLYCHISSSSGLLYTKIKVSKGSKVSKSIQ